MDARTWPAKQQSLHFSTAIIIMYVSNAARPTAVKLGPLVGHNARCICTNSATRSSRATKFTKQIMIWGLCKSLLSKNDKHIPGRGEGRYSKTNKRLRHGSLEKALCLRTLLERMLSE